MAILVVAILAVWTQTAAAQVEFKLKAPSPGKQLRESTVVVNQTLSIGGADLKTESDSAFTLSTVAGQKDNDGNIPVQVKFETVRSNMALPGNINVNFDSANNLAKVDNPLVEFLLDALKALHGATFTTVFSPDNELVRVEGMQKAIDAAGEKGAGILKGQLSEERMKKDHEQLLARYPKKPLKPGDTWELTEEVDFGSGQIMKMLRQYEYAGTQERGGRTLDKINAVDKKIVSFEAEPNEAQPFKISDPELTIAESKGTILFDRQAGSEVENSRLMHIKGKIKLTINGMELPTGLDLKMETADRVKPE
jgi:hypothetical protein